MSIAFYRCGVTATKVTHLAYALKTSGAAMRKSAAIARDLKGDETDVPWASGGRAMKRPGLVQMSNAAIGEAGEDVPDHAAGPRGAIHPVGHAGRAQAGGAKEVAQELADPILAFEAARLPCARSYAHHTHADGGNSCTRAKARSMTLGHRTSFDVCLDTFS